MEMADALGDNAPGKDKAAVTVVHAKGRVVNVRAANVNPPQGTSAAVGTALAGNVYHLPSTVAAFRMIAGSERGRASRTRGSVRGIPFRNLITKARF